MSIHVSACLFATRTHSGNLTVRGQRHLDSIEECALSPCRRSPFEIIPHHWSGCSHNGAVTTLFGVLIQIIG